MRRMPTGPQGPPVMIGLSTTCSLFRSCGQLPDLLVPGFLFSHLSAHLVGGVDHRRVIASPEAVADLGQGEIRELTAQVHGYLPSVDEGPGATGRAELVGGHIEVLSRYRDD